MPATRLPRLQILGAALLFSTGGAAIKACTLTNWQIASFRSGIAALALLAVLPASRRWWQPRTLAVGAVYAVGEMGIKPDAAVHEYLLGAADVWLKNLDPKRRVWIDQDG